MSDIEIKTTQDQKAALPKASENFTPDVIKQFNAIWHAINDGDVYTDDRTGNKYDFKGIYNNSAKKRAAFDLVYETATNATLKNAPEEVKEYMNTAWLKYGFELADGTDRSFNRAKEFLNELDTDKTKTRAFKFTLENWNNNLDRVLQNNDVKKLLDVRKDIWDGNYKDSDIKNILSAVSRGALDKVNPEEWQSSQYNLRELVNNEEDKTIEVTPMEERTPEEAKNILDTIGIDVTKADDRELLQDVLTQYANQ